MERDILYFISCTTSWDDILKLNKSGDSGLLSIYNVCGVHPWLIICRYNLVDRLLLLHQNNILNIKYMSIAQYDNKIETQINFNRINNNIIFWVFLKCSEIDINSLINNEIIEKYNITELYRIVGEYNYLLKIYSSNINGIDEFLNICRYNQKIDTSTKCVLFALRENGNVLKIDEDKQNKKNEITTKHLDYAVARIIGNSKLFLQKDILEQKQYLFDCLSEMKIPYTENQINNLILNPNINKQEYSINELRHPNKIIDRYSVKLEKYNWLKVLLFFKASQTNKSELEDKLQIELLGVSPLHFSRKLYHITGEYDFIIPFDCANIDELNKVIKQFWKNNEKLILKHTKAAVGRNQIEKYGVHPILW